MELHSPDISLENQGLFHQTYPSEKRATFGSKDYWGQIKRLTGAVLPFFGMHAAIAPKLTFGSHLFKVISLGSEAYQNETDERSYLPLMKASSIFAFSLISRKLTLFLSQTEEVYRAGQELSKNYATWGLAKSSQAVIKIASSSFYLIALSYGSISFQVGSMALQIALEAMLAKHEWNEGFYLEASSHLILGMIYAKTIQPEVYHFWNQIGGAMVCQALAKRCFSLAHLAAKPIHKATWNGYKVFTGKEDGSTWKLRAIFVGQAIASLALTPVTLASSSLGAALQYLSGMPYLYMENTPQETLNPETLKVLNYNVGFLPGELAEKLTVGNFSPSFEGRKELIADYLVDQYQKHDMLLLEEAVDTGFVELLAKKLTDENLPFCMYSRIGANPLTPGIQSGLCIISKAPPEKVDVYALSGGDPFFNRAFVDITAPQGHIIHTHLAAGDEDEVRFSQMRQIAEKIRGFFGALIGDYNFSDQGKKALANRVPELQIQDAIGEDSTMLHPENNETHPDLIARFGENGPNVTATIQNEIHYSDHLPISVTVSAQSHQQVI